jgi:surface polysaccharide O-acyltransferase-like enzyme
MVPWMIWYIFYAVLNYVLKRPVIQTDKGLIAGILAGPSLHLWYMPYMFVVMILWDLIKTHLNARIVSMICISLVLPIFVVADIWRPWSFGIAAPWTQYVHAGNAVLLGFFFASFDDLPPLFSTGILFLAISLALSVMFVSGVGTPYFIGTLISALVILPRLSLRSCAGLNHLADCTLGIYLSHPFWNFVVTTRFHFPELMIPLVVFALSSVSVWCLRRFAPGISKYAV